MEKRAPTWLNGQLLLASPTMEDSRFASAVVFICSHTPTGAMGLVLNKPIADMDVAELLAELDYNPRGLMAPETVYFGGPVETQRGFVLHGQEGAPDDSVKIGDDFALTATQGVLEAMANGEGPVLRKIMLGYAGWAGGQLEGELQTTGWLIAPATPALVFETPPDEIWQKSLASIGVAAGSLVATAGHA